MVMHGSVVCPALGAVLQAGGRNAALHQFGAHKNQDQAAQPLAVPVTTATSKASDLPVYLRGGTGTMQALNAVEPG